MSDIRAQGKIYNLGHYAIQDLFKDPVCIQPKIDGSYGSFAVYDGVLRLRSRRKEVPLGTTDKLFAGFAHTAERLFSEGRLEEGWVYRGEVVASPKHNSLEYDRVPEGNIIIFDIDMGVENYIHPRQLPTYVRDNLGLEAVPLLYEGVVNNKDELDQFLERESILGGPKEEGIVIKNYHRFGRDGKILRGKMVRDAFKEKNKQTHAKKDIVQTLVDEYRNENRWRKAIQRLREDGRWVGEPKDIGPLIGEIQKDVYEECKDEIANKLFSHFWKNIGRGLTRGFPEWYKSEYLPALQFEHEEK